MIVRDKPGFFRLFFIFRLSVMERIYPQLLFVMGLSALVVSGHLYKPDIIPSAAGAPFALIGIALSIFLGFRNNACYDRWWEARKLWGHLVAINRDLPRQTLLLEVRGPDAIKARLRLLYLSIIFTQKLVDHLRDGNTSTAALQRSLDEQDLKAIHSARNAPEHITYLMGETLAQLRQSNVISDIEFSMFDRTIGEISGVLTACERLRNTPVPFGYTLLLHRTAYLFCFLLPFGFADALGFATPLAAGVVAYAFFGLDALSEELEEPFGTSPNDLPIAAIATMIEIGLRNALGETDLQEPPQPQDFVLL
ncbi:bestrophin family ion channel [Agrobacterium sp.]|uniref:bestrophin family protein n=1 Tax=Agrobacterium sp. TaxID=361 RepID=UPI0028B12E15|nr:bestrophin family ion channel [Agrobacterium sp.]